MTASPYLPFIFYGLGSICFFIGTLIAMWQIWGGR